MSLAMPGNLMYQSLADKREIIIQSIARTFCKSTFSIFRYSVTR